MSPHLLLLSALAATLMACAPAVRIEPVAAPPATEDRQQVRIEMAADRPLQALRLIGREMKKGKGEAAYARQYALAIDTLLEAAAQHRQSQRYFEAGDLLRQVLIYWPRSPEVAGRLGRSAEAVRVELRECADRLMEQGLLEYRQGHLEEAIASWQQVVAIDPAHPAAGQALGTASLQLKNLRALE